MKKSDKRILVISDLHIPYHHRDAFKFLAAIKKKFNPTRIINIGDEVDNHAISFHDSDPDLMSAGDELKAAQKACAQLKKIFPKMDLVHSNHGSLLYRRGKAGGIPKWMLRDYQDVLEVGSDWEWFEEIHVGLGKQDIFFRHQFKANILKAAEEYGCCVVQGHYHSKFEIAYTSSPRALNWGMSVGCLIDKKVLAFAYNKTQTKRPVLGIGLIEDGQPRIAPMIVDKNGNWDGKLYNV